MVSRPLLLPERSPANGRFVSNLRENCVQCLHERPPRHRIGVRQMLAERTTHVLAPQRSRLLPNGVGPVGAAGPRSRPVGGHRLVGLQFGRVVGPEHAGAGQRLHGAEEIVPGRHVVHDVERAPGVEEAVLHAATGIFRGAVPAWVPSAA